VSAEYITNNRKSRTLWETVWDSNPGSTVWPNDDSYGNVRQRI